MTEDQPERPPTVRFLAALEVKRNATVGAVSGSLFAAVLFLFFVALAPETAAAPVFYVGLAFVVAVSVGGMVAVVLTIRSAVRLSRELEGTAEYDGAGPLEE